MTGPLRWTALLAIVVCTSFVPSRVRAAETTPPVRDRAAALYDEAVRAFDRGDFVTATDDFLAADELVPNADALDNALTSAERARKPLLVVTVAERTLARSELSPSLLSRARRAFETAMQGVGWLVVGCNAPCELRIDGAPAAPGRVAVATGVHFVTGSAANGASSERRVDVAAGTEKALTLDLASRPVTVRGDGRRTPPRVSAVPTPRYQEPKDRDARRPLPRAVFFAGGAVSAGLAGVTAWSGFDALAARNRLPGTREQTEDVRHRMHRTDALLVGTLIATALTAYAGLAWVDWGGTP